MIHSAFLLVVNLLETYMLPEIMFCVFTILSLTASFDRKVLFVAYSSHFTWLGHLYAYLVLTALVRAINFI